MLAHTDRRPGSENYGALSRRRVLVVDDDPNIVRGFAILLKSAGFEVRTAADGIEALHVASAFQPTVVLLDIGLPGIDGFEVARRLRADIALKAISIIAVTSDGSEESRQQADVIGFDQYVVKPVLFADLVALLKSNP
jgi:DNA-binding response OmpR family regulator